MTISRSAAANLMKRAANSTSVERLALRLPFGFLQKHPLRLQLRTFLDLGLDLINQGLRFRWPHFEGRTPLAPRLFRFLFLRNFLLPNNLTPGSCG